MTVRRRLHGTALFGLLVVATGLLAAPNTSAYVPLRLHFVGHSYGPLLSDGQRWAAYQPTPRTTRIFDSHTRGMLTRSDPAGCARHVQGGGLVGVGGGQLLYRCTVPGCHWTFSGCPGPGNAFWSTRYIVEDAATGAEHELSRLAYDPEGPQVYAIGSVWAQADAYAYKYDHRFYVNWHTGEEVQAGSERSSTVVDLNAPSLTRSLCSPLRRRSLVDFENTLEEIFSAPPFAVEQPEVRKRGPESELAVETVLRHCGSKRRERLSYAAPDGGGSMQVGGSVASWIAPAKNESAAFYVTRLTDRARTWHGPTFVLYGPSYGTARGTPDRGTWSLAHTYTTAYLAVALQEQPGIQFSDGLSNVYAAQIP